MTATNPLPITSRAQLVDALAVACELEHGLSLQYLFSAFSLRKDPDEWLGEGEELLAVRKWAGRIFFVAAQEMLHLAQAANLLIAVGGAPHLARPNFPQPAGTYPPRLEWELTRFSRRALDAHIAYEKPTPDPTSPIPDPDSVDVDDDPVVPSRLRHATIGQMYAAIEDAFEHSRIPTRDLFIGRPEDQIPGALVDFPQLVEVVDRSSAARAITLIIDQGEGSRRDHVDSHWGAFVDIAAELAEFSSRPGFVAARPVADNPMAEVHTDVGVPGPNRRVNLITDPTTRAVQDLFTVSYDVLVLGLFGLFAGGNRDPAAPAVKRVALELMMTVIRPLGELLTRLPMGPGYEGLTAGPSFEMFPEIELLPHAAAARLLMADRLVSAGQLAGSLAAGSDVAERQAGVLAAVSGNLIGLAKLLQS